MKIQAIKGTRDFYPEVMRVRNYILDAWRRVSLRNGFEEYDAPILESLSLFTIKSGEEIAEQLFSFTDRGNRDIAMRPELTPSLARMVASKINTLPRPIKWFSMPRLFRAERPQRGRLREFFQWNIDIIGEDSIQADAECIYTLIDFLREVKLTPADIQVHIGLRPAVSAMLKQYGVADERMDKAFLALDKKPKLPAAAFETMMTELGLSAEQTVSITTFMDCPSDEAIAQLASIEGIEEHATNLQRLYDTLKTMGVADYIRFDFHIVRGLAYYTGVVYEALAAGERAVAGGGRYDNLLQLVGGPAAGATGFGMGDVVLGILLDEKGKLPEDLQSPSLDVFVIDAGDDTDGAMLQLVGELRERGVVCDYSFKRAKVAKQLKEANRRGAKQVILIEQADLTAAGSLSVKTFATGEQTTMTKEDLFASL
mgnify:CR=1 FL=1